MPTRIPRRRSRNNGARGGRRIDFVEIGANTGYDEERNDGFDRVDASRCDIVGFCDADCRPARDWLEHLLAPFARDAITCRGGGADRPCTQRVRDRPRQPYRVVERRPGRCGGGRWTARFTRQSAGRVAGCAESSGGDGRRAERRSAGRSR
ncbi:glycosyltransferase [Burkholderia anthinoferrum]|uniref:glycosyltransferase n=1 Tax=Burkholderia anthinoferrum TaxID=3090833 RepID=UPI00292A52C6